MAREKLVINPKDLDEVVSSDIRNTDISLDADALLLSQRPPVEDDFDVDALVDQMSQGNGKVLQVGDFKKNSNNGKKAA